MKTRVVKCLSLMLALVVVFATFCGSASANSGSITLMASQNWIRDIDRELYKKFEDETGIEVKILVSPDNSYSSLLGSAMMDGGNAIDVFMFAAGYEMVSAGIPDITLDLSDQPWVSELEEWAITENSYNGKLIGHSTWGVDYEGVLYNKTYFEENNLSVPTTWDDFVALCDQILSLGKIPLYENINGTWHTNYWLFTLTQLFLNENPNFINDLNASPNNKFSDNAKVWEALEQIRAFLSAKDDSGRPKYYTNDGQSEDFFGSYPSLANRETVMYVTWSALAAELEVDHGTTDEWGMFPLPVAGNDTCNSNGGGISRYINKNSNNIDACLMFFEFLSRMENLEAYYANTPSLITSAFKGVTSVKPTTATIEALERSKSLPPVRMINTILYWDNNMYVYWQGLAAGTMTVEQMITNMDNHRAVMFEAAGD